MISIVIPIYNAAPFLMRCVGSLQRFVSAPFQIILVDDGSTDGSSQLCDQLAIADDRIVVVHQPNKGVSAARNAGIAVAHGQWLWFVDADDYIVQEVPEPAEHATIVVMGCVWCENEQQTFMNASVNDIPYNTWRCIFRRDVIKRENLQFKVGRQYAEDQEFILKYTLADNEQQIEINSNYVYYYTIRKGSAITAENKKCKQLLDIVGVWFNVCCSAIRHKQICQKWILRELKRLFKSFIITLVR